MRRQRPWPTSSPATLARWLVLVLMASAPPAPAQSVADRVEFSAAGNFSATAVRRGVKATRAQCLPLDNAVWVDGVPRDTEGDASDGGNAEAAPEGECLRYWAAGFGRGSKRAIVYFAGDVWMGAGRVEATYPAYTIEQLRVNAERWSQR